jgi:hypothetical protein
MLYGIRLSETVFPYSCKFQTNVVLMTWEKRAKSEGIATAGLAGIFFAELWRKSMWNAGSEPGRRAKK